MSRWSSSVAIINRHAYRQVRLFSTSQRCSKITDRITIEGKKEYLEKLKKALGGEVGNGERIPPDWYTVKFSRSQGAGGQHVNTTNSQASVTLDFDKVKSNTAAYQNKPGQMPKIPGYLCNLIWQANKPYKIKDGCLLIRSSESRSSHENLREALDKTYRLLVESIEADIPGETSQEKKDRVQGLIKRQKSKDRISKQKRSDSKANRKVGKWDF